MSTPRLARAAYVLFHQIQSIARDLTKQLIRWLLRSWFLLNKQTLFPKAGFVLPTTILLLLVVTLTVGAISFRTFTRTQQTISDRQQSVIYNAATPAIDRAKAKLEFAFDGDRDNRAKAVPSQIELLSIIANDGTNNTPRHSSALDPYTLPDETRLDLNGDGRLDNAWRYRADTDGNGSPDATVAYSLLFQAPGENDPANNLMNSQEAALRSRANNLMVRNAPLSSASVSEQCRRRNASGQVTNVAINADGWFPDPSNTVLLRKNFQVDAYVLPDSPNGSVATLEFQQDRLAIRGFRWAAWFRNDLEIFPGPQFNWNGAMHTEGNLIVGGSNSFRGFLISSPASCLYTEGNSMTTVADKAPETNRNIAFQGQIITGTLRDNNYNGVPVFDLFDGRERPPITAAAQTQMPQSRDSLNPGSRGPADFALDPVRLQTEEVSVGRVVQNPGAARDGAWPNQSFFLKRRLVNENQNMPFVDDTFRADNRYGPKPKYTDQPNGRVPGRIGAPISGRPDLIGNEPGPGQDEESVGLDGYWERRARREGLRLIVGQRLELGDPAGWGGPGGRSASNVSVNNEPLRPWVACAPNLAGRCNEARQRKTIWDNLAAVQATAIYHGGNTNDRDFPVACLATTVHPGTAGTLARSSTFKDLGFGVPPEFFSAPPGGNAYPAGSIISDFFRGEGSNAWQFETPSRQAFADANSPLRATLRNLAQYAGDPLGGAPSFTPVQERGTTGTSVHPYPSMAMWGDFSMLRRVIMRMEEEGIAYDALSPADKTTLHTVGCTMGMLAYNVDYLETFAHNYSQALSQTTNLTSNPIHQRLARLGQKIWMINTAPARRRPYASPTVIPPLPTLTLSGLATPSPAELPAVFDPNATRNSATNPPQSVATPELRLATIDQQRGNPETYIKLLEEWRDASTDANFRRELTEDISLARLIVLSEQVARDRQFGFFGSVGTDPGSVPGAYATRPFSFCSEGSWTTYRDAFFDRTDLTSIPIPLADRNRAGFNQFILPLASLCSSRPRYPILHSLFSTERVMPVQVADIPSGYQFRDTPNGFQRHGDTGSGGTTGRTVRDSIDSGDLYIQLANTGVIYQVVRPADLVTRPLNLGGIGMNQAWTLPAQPAGTGAYYATNSNENLLIKVCSASNGSLLANGNGTTRNATPCDTNGSLFRVAFKDAAFMNGRELMPVRTLDLDLDLLRSTQPAGINDNWLTREKGVVYAFREDAVSEAHIVRPAAASWNSCNSDRALQTVPNCQMATANRNANNSLDPPVNDVSAITPKPVDYFADPDRRPHGFRLRNGASIQRGNSPRGISFISHNPVYIQGPFNLHRPVGSNDTTRASRLEEFTEQLTDDFSNFYSRRTIESRFARPETDQWRPAEVLADAVTPLSPLFCDGSIEDGILSAGGNALRLPPNTSVATLYGCRGTNINSFLNHTRPSNNPTGEGPESDYRWQRTNNILESLWRSQQPRPATGVVPPLSRDDSPIFIRGNTNPALISGISYTGQYYDVNGGKPLIAAPDGVQMNLIMVSGIVPSRPNQAYGGLHNFPRFIENWGSSRFFISGAFLQLSFSTYATAPFDQDRWEVSTTAPSGAELITYYSPPQRRWGYDVGIQYAAAGPVAQRFEFSEPIRNEFYTEPPASDPYIRNLCRQIPGASCPT
jgi:hypothetical protein